MISAVTKQTQAGFFFASNPLCSAGSSDPVCTAWEIDWTILFTESCSDGSDKAAKILK